MEQQDNKQQVAGVDLSQLTAEQQQALLKALKSSTQTTRQQQREAYEGMRKDFMEKVRENLLNVVAEVKSFHQWLERESKGFTDLMREYGQLKNEGQQSYSVTEGDFRLDIKSNNVKGFDERAELAAERLVLFLKGYMEQSDRGKDDPMYQLAMTLLERNQRGDLDYKSISKLYELEDKFGNAEYSDIMSLFKESNVVQKTALNYYFWRRDPDTGVWTRIEPSFCRM